ncbi:type VI secretion system-associated protein TagF [uncultured Tateyamaria sp.]|uniref:type VI secretion system-associated protein TagF n=1 Tax=uncultured Tateyamaria sp. TaxID=455651 RepID=UPI002602B6DB|nr:type VI secretion system-associated protein TagF [uncultured Tateyamaria sp.]
MSAGFGAFGKIPGMGDFLKVNLPASFVQAWDTWLQEGLLALRERMGTGWNDAYLSAPIWRFTLPAGIAGDRAMSGILMASVDRVGRQYPMTIATPHPDTDPALTHFANRTVFEQLEKIALSALDDEIGRDRLMSALDTVTFVAPAHARVSGRTYIGALPAAQVLAADSLTASHGTSALWSAMLQGNHRLMLTRDLPNAAEMQGLFDLSAPLWAQAQVAQTA